MKPERSYLVCATPRSGSTLVCKALSETGVAGRPEEYFEALLHSGVPRKPEEYFVGVDDQSIFDHLGQRGVGRDEQPRSPHWSRTAYDRYVEWAQEAGTTENGVFGAKLMWGYFGDFVSLLRNVPDYRDLPLAELLPDGRSPDFSSSAWSGRTRSARPSRSGRRCRRRRGARTRARAAGNGSPPYQSFVEQHRPEPPLPLRRDLAPARTGHARRGGVGRVLRAHPDQADAGPLRELRGGRTRRAP